MNDLAHLTNEELSNLKTELNNLKTATELELEKQRDEVRKSLEAILAEFERRNQIKRKKRSQFVFDNAAELIDAFDIQHVSYCTPERPQVYANSCIRCALEDAIAEKAGWQETADYIFQDHNWRLSMKTEGDWV